MKFKVGDKVRLSGFLHADKAGIVCKVIEVHPWSKYPYRVKQMGSKRWKCSVFEREIEPVSKIGEQLLLFEL